MVYMSGDNNLESYIVKDLELELAALMTQKACALYDAGFKGAGEASNMAKYAAAEAAIHCVDQAIQVHGGNGVAVINYMGRVGARIVVVAEDGAYGDAVASSVEAAAEICSRMRGVVSSAL